jgi:hypothetical protein
MWGGGVDTCFCPLAAGKTMFAGVTLAALLAFLATRTRGGVAKQVTAIQPSISELDKVSKLALVLCLRTMACAAS